MNIGFLAEMNLFAKPVIPPPNAGGDDGGKNVTFLFPARARVGYGDRGSPNEIARFANVPKSVFVARTK